MAFSREFMRLALEPLMDEVRELRQSYLNELEEIIESGIRDNTFHRTEARIVALQLIGMCSWTWTWMRANGRLKPEEIATVFADTVLNGLANVTGNSSSAVAI